VQPLLLGKDRLPNAQAEVRLPAQIGAARGRPGQDALEFLKQRVGVFETARSAVAGKPLGKIMTLNLSEFVDG
jgi:hypothetical protein